MLPTVQVTGTLLDAAEQPLSGKVIFTPVSGQTDALGSPVPGSVISSGGSLTIPMTGVTAVLDAAGHFSVALVPTDTAGLEPAGWQYQVTISVPGVPDYGFTCFIPASPSPVDLSALGN